LWGFGEGGKVTGVFYGGFVHFLHWKWSEVTVVWQVHKLTGFSGEVNAVAISSDGKFVVSGSDHKFMQIWDAVTGAKVRIFVRVEGGGVGGLCRGGFLASWVWAWV